MPKRPIALMASAIVGVAMVTTAANAQTHRTTFTNTNAVALPGTGSIGTAGSYPSTISVSGVSGVAYHVTVTLNITHTFPADLDILLVGPLGQAVMLISDIGSGDDWSHTTIQLDDCAPRALGGGLVTSGRFKPTNRTRETSVPTMPAPAPSGSYESALAQFNWLNPNGMWSLYVNDDASGDVGLLNSWSLTIYDQPATPLPLSGGLNPVSCAMPDYDGDGRADIAIYRPPTGDWFISQSGSNGALTQVAWGAPASSGLGDTSVPADYDGDGVTDVAVYRQATGDWFIRKSFGGTAQIAFGAPSSLHLGDTPVPADYDGDGLADLAIFRTTTGQWFRRSSAGLGVTITPWGSPNVDRPAR